MRVVYAARVDVFQRVCPERVNHQLLFACELRENNNKNSRALSCTLCNIQSGPAFFLKMIRSEQVQSSLFGKAYLHCHNRLTNDIKIIVETPNSIPKSFCGYGLPLEFPSFWQLNRAICIASFSVIPFPHIRHTPPFEKDVRLTHPGSQQ